MDSQTSTSFIIITTLSCNTLVISVANDCGWLLIIDGEGGGAESAAARIEDLTMERWIIEMKDLPW